MGLLDDLKNPNLYGHRPSVVCSTCLLLKELSKEEVKALEALLQNPKVSHASICRVLKANGIHLSDGAVARHRRGECVGAQR